MSALKLPRPRFLMAWVAIALGFLGGWGLAGWGLHAREPGQKAQARQAKPVGAVDDDDISRAGDGDTNWIMHRPTSTAQRQSP